MIMKNVCIECRKKVKKGYFRCDPCTEKAVMDTTKRTQPVGGSTRWKQADGSYTPRP
jgi:hypothetical protein